MSSVHSHGEHGAPESQLQSALAALRAHGERITAPRRQVLEVLASLNAHCSADEVADRLNNDGVHRTTVYRTLEVLVDCGIVSVRQLPGQAAAYHLATSNHLHGHCLECDGVVALDVVVLEKAAEQLVDQGFELDLHRSTLVGRCQNCSAA